MRASLSRLYLVLSGIGTGAPLALHGQATSFEGLARQLVAVINAGDSAGMVRFLTTHLSPAALAATPLVDQVAYLQTIARTSGGLTIGAVTGGGRPVELRVVTRDGHWGQIYVFSDPRDSTRIGDYGAIARRSPMADSADPWPEERLPSESRLVAEIARHAGGAVARDEFSGVVLVARGDRAIFQRGYGLADRDWGSPNDTDTRFALASMGKMFTAVAIAQLAQAGKLRFTDTLAQVLPDYPNAETARRITIAQLLSHSAGLGMLFDRPAYDPHRRYRRHADLLPVFASAPLLYEPGTASAYSNEGFVVLGAVVERLSGERFEDYLRVHVFQPAGMAATGIFTPNDVVPHRAVGYAHGGDDPLGVMERRPNWPFLHAGGGEAAGGEYSTAPDLLRFVAALRSGRLVRRDLVDSLLTPHTPARAWYGYGFFTGQRGGKAVRGHSGGGAGAGMDTDCNWFVDGSYTVIVLSNYDPLAARTLSDGILELLARQ